METFKNGVLKISVRNLVEFILRSGDIDNRTVSGADKDAMQEGARLHKKIQGKMQALFPFSHSFCALCSGVGAMD